MIVLKTYNKEFLKKLYDKCRNNENVTDEQADFLEALSSYRHTLHANPEHYFYGTKKTQEIDLFFAMISSVDFFNEVGLPFPQELLEEFENIRISRLVDCIDHPYAVDMYSEHSEKLNSLIENYLNNVDETKGTSYAPKHVTREQYHKNYDPINTTKIKLNNSALAAKRNQERLEKALLQTSNMYYKSCQQQQAER